MQCLQKHSVLDSFFHRKFCGQLLTFWTTCLKLFVIIVDALQIFSLFSHPIIHFSSSVFTGMAAMWPSQEGNYGTTTVSGRSEYLHEVVWNRCSEFCQIMILHIVVYIRNHVLLYGWNDFHKIFYALYTAKSYPIQYVFILIFSQAVIRKCLQY